MKHRWLLFIFILMAQMAFSGDFKDYQDDLGYTPSQEQWEHMHQGDNSEPGTGADSENNEGESGDDDKKDISTLTEEQKAAEAALKAAQEAQARAEAAKEAEKRTIAEAQSKADEAAKAAKEAVDAAAEAEAAAEEAINKAKIAELLMKIDSDKYRAALEEAREAQRLADEAKQNALIAEENAKKQKEDLEKAELAAKNAEKAAKEAELAAENERINAEKAKLAALLAEQESKEALEKYKQAEHELEQAKLRFVEATKKDTELINKIAQMKKEIKKYKEVHEGELGIGKNSNKEAKIELNEMEIGLKRTLVLQKEYEQLRATTALAYSEAYKKLGDTYTELNITGDPVRISTGEYICECTDYTAQDYLQKFTVERNYKINTTSSFGDNWTCSLDSRIIRGCYPDLSNLKPFYDLYIQTYEELLSDIKDYDETYPEYSWFETEKTELQKELQLYQEQKKYVLSIEAQNSKIKELNNYVLYGEYSDPFSCDFGEESLVYIDTLGNSYVCFLDSDGVYIPCAPLSSNEFCIYCYGKKDEIVLSPIDAQKFVVQYKGGQKCIFSDDGILSQFIDNHNNKSEFYSQNGIIDSVKLKTNEIIKITRNSGRLITCISGDVSGASFYEYSGNRLTSVTQNDGMKINFSYDNENDLVSIIKPDNSTIKINYEYYSGYNKKMVSSIENEEGQIESFDYDYDDKLVNHKNIAGQEELFCLNDKGNTIYHKIEDDVPSSYEYDDNGLLIKASEKKSTVNYYYENFYPVSENYSDGTIQQYQYNQFGELIKKSDRDGIVQEFVYDENHNCVQVKYSGEIVSSREFYPNGLLQTVTEKDCKTSFIYNQYGSVSSCVSEYKDGTVLQSSYEYDKKNRLVSYDDGKNNKIQISYTENTRTEFLNNNSKVEYFYDKRGNLIKLIDTDLVTNKSEKYNYSYDRLNRVTSIFINDQLYRKIKYANDNQIKAMYQFEIKSFEDTNNLNVERNGFFAVYEYDKKGRAICEESGECVINGNDETSIQTKYLSKAAITYKDNYGTFSQIVTMDDYAPVEYVYSNEGFILQINQADNSWRKYEYSPAGRLLKEYSDKNDATVYSYDKNGTKITQINDNKILSEYIYNLEGKLIQKTDNLGEVLAYEYDSRENLTKIKYPNYSIEYEYDVNNREKSCVLLDGNFSVVYKRAIQIDEPNHKIKIVEGDKYVTEYDFDGHYNLIGNQSEVQEYSEILQNGITALNENGYLLKQQNYDTGTTIYDYDYLERKVVKKNANGDIYKFWYDNQNNLIKEENPAGDICQYFYDEAGRINKFVDFENNTFDISYENITKGNLEKITFSNGAVQTIQKDFMNNVTKVSAPTGDYLYEYDIGGKLISEEDSLSNVKILYDYDEKGRCIQKTSSSFDFTYEYEENSNLIKTMCEKKSNFQIDFIYENGLETQRIYSNGVKIETGYDGKNRKIFVKTYTPYGIVSSAEYITYDENNRIASIADKDGNETDYFYDDDGRLVKVLYPFSQEHLEASKKEAIECGLYIKDDQPLGCTNYIQNGTLQYCWYEEYSYTPVGNVKSVTNPFGTMVYDYDVQGRLINKHSANTMENGINYEWSKNGNLIAVKNSQYEVEFLYENENRPVQMIVKDKINGEMHTTKYEYDVFGRRISEKQDDSDVHRYIYDGFSTDILVETPLYNNNSAFINYSSTIKPEAQEKYRYFETETNTVKTYKDDFTEQLKNTSFVPKIYASCNGNNYGQIFYDSNFSYENDYEIFIYQNQGSAVSGVFDKNGSFISEYTYDVWGNSLKNTQNSDNLGYSGSKNKQISQFSLYNIGYRDYSPQMKSFTSTDPARFGDNWYSYCSCDPINFIDAEGFYKKGLTEAEKAYYAAGVVSCASFILSEAKEKDFSAGIWNLFDCADVSTAIDRIASKLAGINDYSAAAKSFDEHCSNGNYKTAKEDVSTELIMKGDANSYRKIDCITSLEDLVKSDLLTPGVVLIWKNDYKDPKSQWKGHAMTVITVDYKDGKPIGAVCMEGHQDGGKTQVEYIRFQYELNDGYKYDLLDYWKGDFVGVYEIEKETGFREDCLK